MTYRNNYTQIFNQTKTAAPDILWQAALGHNPELSYFRKFGRNQDVASGSWEDIWDYGGDYNWPSDSGETMYISSDNGADTQNIVVEGLDENFVLKTETVALQGVTFVTLTGLWSRVHRAYNDDSTDLAGTVYISSDNTDAGGDGIPDVTTAIHATIPVGENQTLQTVYTVPADKEYIATGFRLNLLPVSGGTIKQARFSIDIRQFGKVWRTQATAGLTTSGNSVLDNIQTVPTKVPSGADIRVRAQGIGAAVEVDAAFSGVLITV